MNINGLSHKVYLELEPPSLEDAASAQQRIAAALAPRFGQVKFPLGTMRRFHPLCQEADWKLTAVLAWDGIQWVAIRLEAGDTTQRHYGACADLGSTTLVIQLVDCSTGMVIAQGSAYNHQIAFGEDILTRIFYCTGNPEKLDEIRRATVDTFVEVLDALETKTGISKKELCAMTVSGNTTMTHFLLGLDAFCVFSSPYAVHVDAPGFLWGEELSMPLDCYIFCFPGKANYLGGDIISGMIATGLPERDELSVFLDIGTNGELVIGNKDFLVCGAGAAGPALEGGVVKTGMRAVDGAVSRIHLEGNRFVAETIGNCPPAGLCGSGIVDLIATLFLHGWIDVRGKYCPEVTEKIVWRDEEGEYGVEYEPGLFFYQSDIDEFIRTKSAAYTMVEYLLNLTGIPMEEVERFYVAGAFGAHMDKESAVAIGMYPDMDRERIICAGNSSLEGARRLLLDLECLKKLPEILDRMNYVQFGDIGDFIHMMGDAMALPHTDIRRFPTVQKRLEENGILTFPPTSA